MKKIIALVVITLLVCFVNAAFALNVEIESNVVKPGENAGIFVILINTENTEIKDIRVKLLTPQNFLVKSENPVYIPSLS